MRACIPVCSLSRIPSIVRCIAHAQEIYSRPGKAIRQSIDQTLESAHDPIRIGIHYLDVISADEAQPDNLSFKVVVFAVEGRTVRCP